MRGLKQWNPSYLTELPHSTEHIEASIHSKGTTDALPDKIESSPKEKPSTL